MQIRKLLQKTVACIALSALLSSALSAAEHRGVVRFGGLPVPGATVVASKGDKAFTAITNDLGNYSFPDLEAGPWSFQVEMLGFTPLKQDVTVDPQAPASEFELKMMAFTEIAANAPPPAPASAQPAATTTAAASESTPENKPAETKAETKKEAAQRGRRGAQTPAPAKPEANSFRRADLNASTQRPGTTPATPPATGEGSTAPPANDPFAGQSQSDLNSRAADGLLINGSVNNSASSPFALGNAFGNNRRGGRSLYNGNAGLIIDHSSLDARPYSFTGQDTPRPSFTHMQGVISFGGPLKIPKLLPRGGPNFFIAYQGTRNRNANTQSVLVPTAAQRLGNFASATNQLGQPIQIFDPLNGQPFSGNVIPTERISAEARALVRLYPAPNFISTRYNYQIPLIDNVHTDALQLRLNRSINRTNQVSGSFGIQNSRTDNPNIFGFLDTGRNQGLNANVSWRHSFSPRFFGTLNYNFSRFSANNVPFFSHRENVSGNAGITGNNQEPINWGPPSLNFSAGIEPLRDGLPSSITNQTNAIGVSMFNSRGRHGLTFGGDFRRLQFNNIAQQNPRGGFTFTGASTQSAAVPGSGSDFAGFLLGIPDTSALAFGNADKYYRSSSYDGFLTDDWRVKPGLTLNVGIRWEYNSPITELYGRLVNLDVAPGFTAVAPVVANQPIGKLTGKSYDDSLVAPDKNAFQPRVALSWRPLPASSMVIRAGYGIYYNTSVYQTIASQMAQQSPLSKSLNVQNSPINPLTLASGFNAAPNITTNSFAVDPNLRVGYAQTYQVAIQRDLPASLVMVATYLGSKGSNGLLQFLPNTYPTGAANPCIACPSGFAFLTSNASSNRNAGQFQLRRRLHSGFAASVQYTYAKAIDDATPGARGGGVLTAQNWLDLHGERGLSGFDQRHLVNIQMQYTSGMGLRGGSLLGGWRGRVLKGWTVSSQINAGSGLPLSPVYNSAVRGTGFTGPLRPDYTGADLYAAPNGLFLNPAAYAVPAVGRFGNAGRNTITGPSQFTLNGSATRSFRSSDRVSMDLTINLINALNHVTYPSYNTTLLSAQFGLPNTANPMRSVQTNFRVRF